MHGALDIVKVPDLVELISIVASDHYINAARSIESGEDVRGIVGHGWGRKNGSSGEELDELSGR